MVDIKKSVTTTVPLGSSLLGKKKNKQLTYKVAMLWGSSDRPHEGREGGHMEEYEGARCVCVTSWLLLSY